MLRKTLLAGAILAFAATPALAHHCPADAAAIDAALAKSNLSAAAKAKINELKEQGMSLHNAGDHEDSEHILADAMRQLLTGFSN